MKEAKKILGYINSTYKDEIDVFEGMGKVDRKRYASYVLRKKVGFLSPSEWLEKKENAGMTFKEIAKALNLSVLEVRKIYEEAMAKMKAIIENGNIAQYSQSIISDSSYMDFVLSKAQKGLKVGFVCKKEWLNPNLFDYQREIVQRACEIGRYALFMDTGLGKSITQMNFAYAVNEYSHKPTLILAPLAVVYQMLDEARKFGFVLHKVENGELKEGLNIINYEQIDNLKGVDKLAGIILDESSILKSFTGSTKRTLLEMFKDTPYKLACSATPSPNDYLELGNHSEFLGVMPSYEMIMRFFINDTMNAGGYRLKKHAESAFWQWVTSWAECISSPSDLGYDGSKHKLPSLREIIHEVHFDDTIYHTQGNPQGILFESASSNATTLARGKKASLEKRVEKLKEILRCEGSTPHLVWVDTNLEADRLKLALIDEFEGAVEVRGSDSAEFKAKTLSAFGRGEIPILITKASIAGMGLNFQNAHNMTFLGLNYSYESYYQAIRRMYRFGQIHEVKVNVIVSSNELGILETLHHKKKSHDKMKLGMTQAICKGKKQEALKTSFNTGFKIPIFLKRR